VRNFGDGPKINPEWEKAKASDEEAPGPRPPVQDETVSNVPAVLNQEAPRRDGDQAVEQLTLSEVVSLGAVDSVFFSRFWLPRTFRQPPALYHPKIWNLLEDPANRYVNIEVNRDGAKTTILRTLSLKRTCYGLSHNILYIGKSGGHATRSVRWIRTQIERNELLCSTFGLNRGKPWSDEEIQILHGAERHPIHILGLGITGSTRGINIDDYRPDLIIIDDVMTIENSATKEQREKIIEEVLGSLKESLAPASESPNAKMVLLNTPQDFEDLSQEAKKDTQFVSARFGCWTAETEHLPLSLQRSSWPARYPDEVLRAEKTAAIARNRYSIFAREKECLLVTPEHCAFRKEWVNFYGAGEPEPEPLRHEMWIEMAIDPVPPKTDIQIKKQTAKTDFEAFAVAGRRHGKIYILEMSSNRGHDPTWTISEFFRLCLKWNPKKVSVESVAYQRTLDWLLREAMKSHRRFWFLHPFDDKRRKFDRIVDGLAGSASHNQIFFRKDQTNLISQFIHYPGKNPDGDYDDELEAAAVVTASLEKGYAGDPAAAAMAADETEILELEDWRGAP
jgi:hypothetical protein